MNDVRALAFALFAGPAALVALALAADYFSRRPGRPCV